MVNRRIGRRRIRRGLVVFLFAASFFRVAAAETANLEVDPGTVIRGRSVTLRVRTMIPWGADVEIEEPELFGSIVWLSMPYTRPWSIENLDGSYTRLVEAVASIRVDEPGFHLIDGFVIRSGIYEVVTEPKEIIGLDRDEDGSSYPVFAGRRPTPESVWAGQAVPVILEARNLESLALGNSVSLQNAPEGLVEEAPGLGGIITHPYGDDVLYDVPVGSWIWTLTEPGDYIFPSARVNVSGLVRTVPSFNVNVRPLPEAIRDSGAVGSFRVGSEWDEGPYSVGDLISVRVRIEGEGNINVLKVPVPEMDGASLVGSGSSSSYIPGPSGYEGWREERFDFQIERAGDLAVRIPGWYWVEPGTDGKIRRIEAKKGTVGVSKSSGTPEKSAASFLLGNDLFRYKTTIFNGRTSYFYLLTLPGFILFVVFFFIKRPGLRSLTAALVLPLLLSSSNIGPEAASSAVFAVQSAREGNWDVAEETYFRLRETYGELPGLLHDAAIVENELGRTDLAVSYLRRAMYLRPGSRRFANTLFFIEEREGLSDQVPVSPRWSPSIPFGLWILASNLFFLALTLIMYKRDAREVILFVSALIFAAASGSAVAFTEVRWDEPTAVVGADAEPLRKIPGPLATDWIKLPSGTAVEVTAVEGTDCLVLTGYGLEGWLPQSSLLLIQETADGF